MPVGSVTRGTTNTNRLRRVDRWIADQPQFRRAVDPLVVDLGYGASGVTAFELAERLRRARPDVRVLGLEIEPGTRGSDAPSLAGEQGLTDRALETLHLLGDRGLGHSERIGGAGERSCLQRGHEALELRQRQVQRQARYRRCLGIIQ